MSVALGAVGQIHISVTDLERSVAFYRDVLGLEHLFTVPGQPMAFIAPLAEETVQMTEETPPPVCTWCGRMPDDESSARLTWALGVENGRQVWTCDQCSRDNLRSIEGKLDSTWW